MILNKDIPSIKVMGFKSNIKDVSKTLSTINKLNNNHSDQNCVVQLLDARGIGGEEHIANATIHAINAFKRGNNIANDLGMEICVRASAQRQISRAIKILGLKEGNMDICAVLVGCHSTKLENQECDDSFNRDSCNNETIIEKELNNLFTRADNVLEADESTLKEIYDVKNEEIEVLGNIIYTLVERTTILTLDA